ncbi:cupin domain-containing protein [Brevibacillus sp. NRS-1366]|uniref:cupin domain-containing protein n=1 Tax=Brevibacillus sp. NRS-1366 TaxID=3233899 RepID=UPI003D211BD8
MCLHSHRSSTKIHILQQEVEFGRLQTTIVQAGDSCYIASGEIHSIRNNGDTPVISLNVYTPPLRNCRKYQMACLF